MIIGEKRRTEKGENEQTVIELEVTIDNDQPVISLSLLISSPILYNIILPWDVNSHPIAQVDIIIIHQSV